jgi:hypothetical protein
VRTRNQKRTRDEYEYGGRAVSLSMPSIGEMVFALFAVFARIPQAKGSGPRIQPHASSKICPVQGFV